MRYAIIMGGVVTNVIVLYPGNAGDFPGAVPCGDVPVAIGDTWDGQDFYRGGEKVVSPLTAARRKNRHKKSLGALRGIFFLLFQIFESLSDRRQIVFFGKV